MKTLEKPDSLIFDMDGTLWDAVDTYAESWNVMFRELGIDKHVTREQLAGMVGWEGKKVIEVMMPEFEPERRLEIYGQVNQKRKILIPEMGGILYDGVKEGLEALAKRYRLFILSNCAEGVIRQFIDWSGINDHITDEIAYGINYMPKNHNIKLLIDKYDLKNPYYVGDTAGDGEQSRLAGIPYVFVTYGFGETDDHDLRFDDFPSLTRHFLEL